MCESIEVGIKFGATRAADLATNLVAAAMRVHDIHHMDIEKVDL